jgi:hypothetical protein
MACVIGDSVLMVSSPYEFGEEVRQLVVHFFAAAGVAGADRVSCTELQVVSQQETSGGAERLMDGRNLHEDIGAVALVLDHLLEAANLSFDPFQPEDSLPFQLSVDSVRVLGMGGGMFVLHGAENTR